MRHSFPLLVVFPALHPPAYVQSPAPVPWNPPARPLRNPPNCSPQRDDYTPKRMFGMIPDFQNSSDIGAVEKPLTAGQKFRIAAGDAFDISAHVGNLFQANLQQPPTASRITARDGPRSASALARPKRIKFPAAF